MSGSSSIGVAKDIAQGMVKLDAATAANAVTVISIANPRVVWYWVSCRQIARIRVITLGQRDLRWVWQHCCSLR